jgi:hypothetical protein
MSTYLSATPASTPLVTRTVSSSAAVTVTAVVVAGFTAAISGAVLAWFLTPLIAWLILRAAVGSAEPAAAPDVDVRELPLPLRHRVSATFDHLPTGTARDLLMEVLIQARPLFAARASGFDARYDASSRENAGALLGACCDTALELARLDASFATRPLELVEPRYKPARELFIKRLTEAASVLGALYASGVQYGTPASDRVAELVDEIRAEATARSAAGDEMKRVIG